MFEQSSSEIPSSIWTSMNSWFTPAVFFVLLNLMIGTIALTTAVAKKSPNQNHPLKTAGSGSVLQRLKSTNFYSHFNSRSQEPPNYKQAPDSAYSFQENFAQVPQDSSVGEPAPDSDTLFESERAHERSPRKTRAHFVSGEKYSILGGFEEARAGKAEEVSERAHEQSPRKTRARFVSGKKDSILGSFDEARGGGKAEEIGPVQSVNDISERAHERSPRKTRARLVSGDKDSILGGFEEAGGGGKDEESGTGQSMDEVFSRLTGGHFGRTKSDTVPASGETTAKLPAKMKKSASLKSAFGHFEEEKIVEARRPATVREAKATEGDVEVDAKADDFISRFKQQLRVQRLDSIIRYKDVIARVSGSSVGR